MSVLVQIFAILVLFSSCAHKPIQYLKAPQLNLSAANFQELPLETAIIVKSYMDAKEAMEKGDTNKACLLFTDLSKLEKLSVNFLALIHRLETCAFTPNELEDIWDDVSDDQLIPQWAKEKYLQISLTLAEKHNLSEYVHQFLFQLVAFKAIPAEKEAYLLKAIDVAKLDSDDDAVDLYTDKLKTVSPRFNEDITDQNIFLVAKDFEKVRQFTRARELYLEIINGQYPLDLKVKTYNAYRTSFKVERDLKTFNLKTAEMVSFLKSELDLDPANTDKQNYYIEAKINLARAHWTAHENEIAKSLITEAFNEAIGSANLKAQAKWVYGSILLEEKDLEQSIQFFLDALKEKPTDNALIENLQWSTVWLSYLSKKDTEAQKYATLYIKLSGNPNFVQRLQYWLAKSLQRTKKQNEANDLFTTVLNNDPFSYYGLLASAELKLKLKPLTTTTPVPATSNDDILDWLIVLKEFEYARNYQKTIDARYKTIDERKFAMSLYSLTSWYEGAMRQIFNFPAKLRPELTEQYHHLIYPTAFNHEVSKYSALRDLPASLVFGIIRQESAFNPNVRSWADAFGLMQMIPEAAIKLSEKYGIPYQSYNDLYVPDTNVAFGTALVSELADKYQRRFIPMVASYNASEDAVQTWLRDRYNGNYLEFIELVPYEETRNYLKLVFRNMMVYERALKKTDLKVDLQFFDHALPITQKP